MRRLLACALLLACGDNGDAPRIDGAPDDRPPVVYRQVEQLARPGINQLLLVSPPLATSYNATAPSLVGLAAHEANGLAAEAKTTLKAFYLGACLANGSIAQAARVSPGGAPCHAVGTAIFDLAADPVGATLTAASRTAAQAYADRVYAQLAPDVLRIDTTVQSHYETPCGEGPLWCGGRRLDDDVMDITYAYLLDGGAAPENPATYDQRGALTSDGVVFSATARGSRIPAAAAAGNPQQGHRAVSGTFPFGAAPY